jgi:hypothetical protein
MQKLSELAQVLHTHPRRLHRLHGATSGAVEHPERNIAHPLKVVGRETATEKNVPALGDRLEDMDLLTIPGMPEVADFSQVGFVGLVLLSFTTSSARTRGSTAWCRRIASLELHPKCFRP